MARGKTKSKAPSRRPKGAQFWIELPLWLLVMVVPLVVDSQGKSTFREPKLHLAQILVLVSILAVLWRLRTDSHHSSWRAWIARPAFAVCFSIFAVAGVSLLTSRVWSYSVAAFFELSIGLAGLLTWSLGLDPTRLKRLLDGLLVPATVLATIGILQFHGIWSPFDLDAVDPLARVRITSLAGASGDLGAFLVLPMLIAQAALAKGRRPRWLMLSVLAVLAYGLAATQSLTAIASLVLGSTLLWAIFLPWRSFLVRGGGVLAILVLAVLAIAPLRARVVRMERVLSRGDLNAALTGRLDAWRGAKAMWAENPVLGVGHGAFRGEFGRTKLRLMEEGESFFLKHQYPNFSVAHNEYLQALAEWGGIGWVGVLIASYFLVVHLWKLPKATLADRSHRSLAFAGTFALALLSIAYFPLHIALTAYPFLLFLAWVLAMGRQDRELAG